MMRCCSKEQIDRENRAKSPKSNIDFCHVCPSKLSKRELEELYYALLQNNMEMKKTFNKQNEQLKMLSTKLQRMMTTQRTYMANEPKDCCSTTKAMVQDQKKTISDLKKANDNLKNEVKNLNMKLCSTRQFLKRSSLGPYQLQNKATSRPTSSIIGPTDSTRNSTSALNTKKPEAVDNSEVKSVSCQCLEKEKMCDENKCRTLMDELKQKIVNLQEELYKTHEEYANRISKLEHEVTDLQDENARVRMERTARDVSLDRRNSEVKDMKQKLRETQSECEDLNTELTIEKGKVAELEAQVKAVELGTPLLKAIEYHLSKDLTNNAEVDDSQPVKESVKEDAKKDNAKPEEQSPRTYPKHKCCATDPNLNDISVPNNDPSKPSIKKDKGSVPPRNSRLSSLNEPLSSKRTDESTSNPVIEKSERRLSILTELDYIPELPELQQADIPPTGKRKESCAICEAEKKKSKPEKLDVVPEIRYALDTPFSLREPSNEKMADPRSAAETTPTKKSDDSGYVDANQSGISNDDEKGLLQKLNNELMDKIADLQKQLDDLKTRMLSNSDTYTIDSDDAVKVPSDTNATGDPKENHKPKRAKKEKDSDELKDSNQQPHDHDNPLNPTCETICRQENLDCADDCINKSINASKKECMTCDNKTDGPKNIDSESKNTDNKSKNINNERRNKDNDNKYQIPGPIPTTSTPVGKKPDVTHALLTDRDGSSVSNITLKKIEDSLIINRELLNRRPSSTAKPSQLRLRRPSSSSLRQETESIKSQADHKQNFSKDPEGKEQPLASSPQNEVQNVNKSPPDVSGQLTKEATVMLTGQNGENQSGDQKTAQNNQEMPQHELIKPEGATTVPVAKNAPSHIKEIIQNLYARFAKATPTSSQAQTEGEIPSGQNIEELQTTSKGPNIEGSPPKVQTEIGLHKCICSKNKSDSCAQNMTPKQADCGCVKCSKNPCLGTTSNDLAKNSVPETEIPVNVIKKFANSDNVSVKFDKIYQSGGKSRMLNDYLNNQDSNPIDGNDVGSQDGPQDQGNQSLQRNSVGTDVPVLENKLEKEGNDTPAPAEQPGQVVDPVILLPPTRAQEGSYPLIANEINQAPKDEYTQLSKEDKAIDTQLDICGHLTHVCTCPQTSPTTGSTRKDVSVFRTCSGTLRFRTTNTPMSGIRHCGCSSKGKHPHCGVPISQLKTVNSESQNNEGVQATERRLNGDTSAPKTYSIHASAELVKCSRATSPENTDQEISSMTDLPSEKDTCSSPRCKKCGQSRTWTSPGEDKATSTSSPATMPTAFSLSEGELPQPDNTTHVQLSDKENDPKLAPGKRNLMENSSSAQMEAALEAISLELARCRKLLQQTRPPEETQEAPMSLPSKAESTEALPMTEPQLPPLPPSPPSPQLLPEASPSPPSTPSPSSLTPMQQQATPPPPPLYPELTQPQGSTISLRKAEARPRIGDAYTPRAMFTLHIGTVVLSDEAVINSRDLSLVLTWQFYDQNVAMSRMRSGRVVHFDFSTEYDLKLTDDFLDYLKADELEIKICEVNKLDEPLASCSLPLREALLHTNRRVDMSLALVAGPQMRWSPPTADALDSGDELGVLDLWCMLRAQPRLLPVINKAISQTRGSTHGPGIRNLPESSAIMTQINEDDQDDIRLSGDLTPNRPIRAPDSVTDRGVQTKNGKQPKRDNKFGYRDSAPFPTYPSSDGVGSPANVPQRLSVDTTDIKHTPNSMEELKNQVSFENRWTAFESRRRSSGIIINEVPANVKTTLQMREALEKNNQKSSLDEYDVDDKRESQGQISIKSLVARRPKKLSLEKRDLMSMATRANSNSLDDFLDNTNFDDKNIIKRSDMEPTRDRLTSDTTELSKKYDNMTKMIGAKKAMEAFKRVKIKKQETPTPATPKEDLDKPTEYLDRIRSQSIDITILWLALNEECSAMGDPGVQRLYVAYTFIGRGGAELETPLSLPKPKQSHEKCYFNFKKSFQLTESDLPILGRMAKCRSPNKGPPDTNDCVVFTVVSEPVEDPLGLNNCEDIGNAHLFFGDLLAYSAGSDTYTEVIPVRAATVDESVCGVLAIRVDGLDVVRKCLMLSSVSDQHQPGVSFW